MSELSTRVRLRREELGLSQEQLAQRMGYRSKSSITKLEKRGQRHPAGKAGRAGRSTGDHPGLSAGAGRALPAAGL